MMKNLFPLLLLFLLFSASNSANLTLPDSLSSCKGFEVSNLATGLIKNLDSSVEDGFDINGDQIPDIIISDYQSPNPSTLYVIYGTKTGYSDIDVAAMTSKQGFKIFGLPPSQMDSTNFISCAGDINGDGISDLVITAAAADNSQNTFYVIYGKKGGHTDLDISNLDLSIGFKITRQTVSTNTDFNSSKLPFKQRFLVESNSPSTSLKNAVYGGSITAYIINRILNIWTPALALPYIYGQLRTSLFYLRYLPTSRTQKLEQAYQLYDDADINIIAFAGLRDSWKESFPTLSLPSVFEQYDLPSTFIVNFGDNFLCLIIILLAFLIVHLTHNIVQKYFKGFSTFKTILYKISITLQNFFIGSFLQSLGPIIFSTAIEFRNRPKGEIYYALSPTFCYLSLLLIAYIFTFHLYLLQKLRTFRKTNPQKPEEYESLTKKYHGVAVLFKEFKENSVLHQSAFLLFNFRAIIEAFIIGFLYESPQAQAGVLLAESLIMLIYLAYKRPYKSNLDLVQQICLMILVFICNSSAIQMARTDHNTDSDNFDDVKDSTSNIIYIVLILFQFIPLPFFIVKLVQAYWKSQQIKTSQSHSLVSPEVSPEQPTGMTTQAHFLTDRVSLLEQDVENPIEKSESVIFEEIEEEKAEEMEEEKIEEKEEKAADISLEVSQPSLAERMLGSEQMKKRRLIKQVGNIWESNEGPENEPKPQIEKSNIALEIKIEPPKTEILLPPTKQEKPEIVNNESDVVNSAIKRLTQERKKQPRKGRWIKPLHQQYWDSLYNIDELYYRATNDESEFNGSEMISHGQQNPELGQNNFSKKLEKSDEKEKIQEDLEIKEEKLEEEKTESILEDLEGKEEENLSKENISENLVIEEEDIENKVEDEKIEDGIKGLLDEDELKIIEMKKEFEKEKKEEEEITEDIAVDFELREAEDLIKAIDKELEDEKVEDLSGEQKKEEELGSFERSLMEEVGGSDVEGESKAKAEQKSGGDDFDNLIKALLETSTNKL